MWDSELINHVAAALSLPGTAENRPVSVLAGYPHIAVLATSTGPLVLKRIAASAARQSWFDDLYSELAAHRWAARPRLTAAGKPTIRCGDSIVIALDWLPAPMVRPTARWWATTLAGLHALTWSARTSPTSNVIDHCDPGSALNLLDAARHLLPVDVRATLLQPLDEPSADLMGADLAELVPSHGDPNSSNVRGVNFKLLDFDRSGWALREYDLQRLLWFRAIEQHRDIHLGAFWGELTQVYQEQSGYKIQRNRLRTLCGIDVAKAAAWLSLVATDPTRADQERQARTLMKLLTMVRHQVLDAAL